MRKERTDYRYTALINLVQNLPDELHHDTMVPLVKSAVFPGRLVHTNEFLVLLGESYYVERTAKQTSEILKRRGKSSEPEEGLVELREEDEEENTTELVSQLGRGHLEQGCPTFSEENKLMGAPEDDEYARIMSRLEELEKELAAKSYGDNEKWDTNAAESDGEEDEQSKVYQPRKPLLQSKGKDPVSCKSRLDLPWDLLSKVGICGVWHYACKLKKRNQCMPQATEIRMLYPSINASVPFEKVKFEAEHSSRDEGQLLSLQLEYQEMQDEAFAFASEVMI
ncbi:hypothetical protein GOBAR_AA17909 [Gossypium barbadense]|uniref:Uncharacterized protein n=1 Tax=Gossypium barbadense TaxID=3634 RepID=A0A2P5XHF2_GOSBA|nr:hypothetical protein GOBAR_AA17909 [Gossypium barbadense]